MAELPSDQFGARLAYYRKLAGISAEALSRRVPGLSRAVIANIESGRKKDVTVDEMIALAWALDVPPVALALPLDRPDAFLVTGGGGEEPQTFTRAHLLADWFRTGRRAGSNKSRSPAHSIATMRLAKMDDFVITRGRVIQAQKRIERGDTASDWPAILQEEARRLSQLTEELAGLGVDVGAAAASLGVVASITDAESALPDWFASDGPTADPA